METKTLTPLWAAIIISLISIVLFLAYYFTGLFFGTSFIKWIPSVITIALLIYFIIKWANDNDNNVTFGSCFGYGFKIICIATLISTAFILIFILITPEFKQQFLEASRQQMSQNSPQLTDDQKTQAVAMMDKMFYLVMLGGSIIGNLIVGVIASLIGAAVAKKNPQNPFTQTTM
ncbi:MAG: DUF4199 domain-containing protein [Chitinophagaceae bacterium]